MYQPTEKKYKLHIKQKSGWDSEKSARAQILLWHPETMHSSATTQKLSDLDFGLLWSRKVESDGPIGRPIYDFLLVFNSNIRPDPAPLRDINLQHLCHFDFVPLKSPIVNVMVPLDSP